MRPKETTTLSFHSCTAWLNAVITPRCIDCGLRRSELQGKPLWEMVRNQLLAQMFMLGRSFNLARILDHSEFVSFIDKQYKQLQEQSAQPPGPSTPSKVDTRTSTAQPSSANDKYAELTAKARRKRNNKSKQAGDQHPLVSF